MSTATEHVDQHHHDKADAHHPTDMSFVKVALLLAALTGLETSTYWWPHAAHTAAMATLLIVMTIKFFMIVLYFMHLKWDSKLFSAMFYIGLGLALMVYLVTLFTFQFFG